jgi:hypothetical protein
MYLGAGEAQLSPCKIKNFPFFVSSRLAVGSVKPPIHWLPEIVYRGVKLPERETDLPQPTSFEVTKTWIFKPTFT